MKQIYNTYTQEDQDVWKILFDRQSTILNGRATHEFLDGIHKAGFLPDRIPNFEEVNARLRELTGWTLQAVPGIADNSIFFEMLSHRKFPATTWLRKKHQLDYLEEPDMFHDVFGHVPLLTHPAFCAFLEGLSQMALKRLEDPTAIEAIARIYWYTVEFGLIETGREIGIYGAGILSSTGETVYCLEEPLRHKEFNARTIIDAPYVTDTFQPHYFVIVSLEQLFDSLTTIEQELRRTENKIQVYSV